MTSLTQLARVRLIKLRRFPVGGVFAAALLSPEAPGRAAGMPRRPVSTGVVARPLPARVGRGDRWSPLAPRLPFAPSSGDTP